MFVQICVGQNTIAKKGTLSKNEFYSKEFRWKILIPAGFESESAEQYEALHKNGAAELEKSLNGKIKDQSKQICSFKNEKFNYFEANEQPFDAKTEAEYLTICKNVDDLLYNNFKKQTGDDAKIDTTLSIEKIDGLAFQCFKLQMISNDEIIMNMFTYSRLFNKKEFTVAIVFINKEKGDLILDAWRNSKFERN